MQQPLTRESLSPCSQGSWMSETDPFNTPGNGGSEAAASFTCPKIKEPVGAESGIRPRLLTPDASSLSTRPRARSSQRQTYFSSVRDKGPERDSWRGEIWGWKRQRRQRRGWGGCSLGGGGGGSLRASSGTPESPPAPPSDPCTPGYLWSKGKAWHVQSKHHSRLATHLPFPGCWYPRPPQQASGKLQCFSPDTGSLRVTAQILACFSHCL